MNGREIDVSVYQSISLLISKSINKLWNVQSAVGSWTVNLGDEELSIRKALTASHLLVKAT